MLDELTGREVVRYEVLEPWCMGPGAQPTGTAVWGALALCTQDAVLTISSGQRFSALPSPAGTAPGLRVSTMPLDAWELLRSRWLAHSAAMGPRPTPWQAGVPGSGPAALAVPAGARLAGVTLRPHGLDAVCLQWEGNTAPLTLACHREWDGAMAWTAGTPPAPRAIAPFGPQGEFAWLHPACRLGVCHPLGLLRSAVLEDWPLALRRAVFGNQATVGGVPLRSSAQVLGCAVRRPVYLDAVSGLMRLRFAQHPLLARRLAIRTTPVSPDAAYADMVNACAPGWAAPAH